MQNLDKKSLVNIFKELKLPSYFIDNIDTFFELYEVIFEGVNNLINNIQFKEFVPINPIVIILYLTNETSFYLNGMGDNNLEKKDSILNDDNFKSYLCSIVVDKYLTNEQLNYKSNAYLNRFNPRISTMNLMLNFCLNILTKAEIKLNKFENLIKDMLKNSFSLAKCIVNLLISGFDVEGFSTWRTMHENECILLVLLKYGENTINSYLKHIEYSLAYRGQIKDKEKLDKIFLEIKSNMKKYDLKSKDMKKYIEYGYLFSIKDIKLNEDFKLNFRDGVEKLAALSQYSKTYELSSEIAHSSPLLIYSNREYYHLITLLNLYDTFFRLEKIFSSFYKNHFKKEEVSSYIKLEGVYLKELLLLYNELNLEFKNKYIKVEHHDSKNHQ